MASVVAQLHKRGLIQPPPWLPDLVQYETLMGSVAYGVSTDESDRDVYGFCMPTKSLMFPHLAGEIRGFGTQLPRFDQYEQAHIKDKDAGREWDFSIYSVVKYFHLAMTAVPNMIDSLFTPQRCVLHATAIGQRVREHRRLFLSKKAWHSYKGYAFSQMYKLEIKDPKPGSRRHALKEAHGFDSKFAYHTVRLLSQIEQILAEGDLDLEEKGRREHMKAIRRGEVSIDDIRAWFADKEKALERLYEASKLPHKPREPEIKQLLVECLEMHYGRLEAVPYQDSLPAITADLNVVLDRLDAKTAEIRKRVLTRNTDE